MKHFLLRKKIEDKSIIWFSKKNQYIVLENKTADILQKLDDKIPIEKIGLQLADEMDVPFEKAVDFIIDIKQKIYLPNLNRKDNFSYDYKNVKPNSNFKTTKYYTINSLVFKVDYESDFELYLIHPKFAHLESKKTEKYDYYYQVFTEHNHTFLLVDDVFIGSWHRKDIHFFQGKFSMQIVQQIHHKEESEWMGVFHASAVSNNKEAILFLGDSGNGKSTSLALLQANGFTCLADDFVPIDIEKKHVYTHPSAISIKKNSLETLLPLYPELENSAEYHFEKLNKTVRYLPPNNTNYTNNLPCKKLVFIKYRENADLTFETISKIDAFQRLLPDSWISEKVNNVSVFFNWFNSLHCYELTYSNNEKMINTVKHLFENDL
ncbi:hypothetical protein [Tenacibaculum sp. IB213877]|uniref:hypothetical protein n=1 Tax=Tenacibaculum sp. IB213877 TaxID=3097351 RepID=UPI002A5B0511|nr:hypothetical protein [Tenacibaculum sp. IB213877]MDY0780103.1 hypothetical protein [Tenacibaculum sp. IB213877]